MSGWNPVPRIVSRGSQEGRDVGPAQHEAALQRPTPDCICGEPDWKHADDCPAGCPPPESSQG